MANSYDDTVSDFDLNFLQPSHPNVDITRFDKQRQSLINVKNKIIASHCLLKKFYLQRDKLEETESLLLASKEECKQACLDYKVTLEKCIHLEKDALKLTELNRELEQKVIHLDNQCEAMKSHAHQLQVLVKEHESVIEALNIEKQLEKSTVKDYEKKIASFEKEREEYLKDIQWMRDVILGKKKSKTCKEVLNKYKHLKGTEDGSDSDNSGDESFFHDSLPASPINNHLQNKEEVITTYTDKIMKSCVNDKIKDKLINDNDCDYCNEEVVSEDTGRGSSLAFSDTDKCFNSPEVVYGVDSHINIQNKYAAIHVDVATSPIRLDENLISRPSIFDDEALLSDNNKGNNNRSNSPEYFITDIPLSTEIVTIKEKRQLVDAGTSPIHHKADMLHKSTSPIAFENLPESLNCPTENTLKPQIQLPTLANEKTQDVIVPCQINIDNLSSGKELEISTNCLEKNCLEQNNSKKICEDVNNDCEIEMILNNMRLEHDLITPIPRTPKLLHKLLQNKPNVLCKPLDNQDNVGCPDALKIREENKVLHANISYLCNEIMLIKNVLKTKMPGNTEEAENRETNKKFTLFDENDQETKIPSKNTIVDDHSKKSIFETNNKRPDLKSGPSEVINDTTTCIEGLDRENSQPQETNSDFENIVTVDNIVPNEPLVTNCKADNNQSIFIDRTLDNNILGNNEDSNPDDQSQEVMQTIEKDQGNQDSHNLEGSSTFGLTFTNNYEKSNNCIPGNKSRKLTKLDRFKKKILPKSKITRIDSPTLRRLRKSTRLVPMSNKEKTNRSLDILNNKEAYEKALKVMSEIKSKNKVDIKNDFRKPNSKFTTNRMSLDKMENTNQNNKSCEVSKVERTAENISPVKLQDNPLPTLGANIRTLSPCHNTSCNNTSDYEKENTNSNCDSKDIISDKTENMSVKTRNRCKIPPITPEHTTAQTIIQCDNNTEVQARQKTTRRRKRVNSNNSDVSCKRMLRSSNMEPKEVDQDFNKRVNDKEIIDYNDLDVFASDTEKTIEKENIMQPDKSKTNSKGLLSKSNDINVNTSINATTSTNIRRRSKRLSSNISENSCKRLLRSSYSESINSTPINNMEDDDVLDKINNFKFKDSIVSNKQDNNAVNMCTNNDIISKEQSSLKNTSIKNNLSNSILCKMIVKHGRSVLKHWSTKVSDTIAGAICTKIEKSIVNVLEAPPDKTQSAITDFVEEIRQINQKNFLAGLMKYLQDPARKLELYNKVNCHASLAMTKREQIILSALQRLNTPECDIVNHLLSYIEFTLFRLNNTPEFDTIESLSHFYAATCRVFHMKYRLKTFLLDAMYCIQYKAIVLIKQCLTTWTHILPLAHMKNAKTPLITCIVYLLHFYKCEDKFNRVQDIRWILNKKYFYTFSDWNETKILEMFSNAIKTVKDDPAERNMLRIALLIFAKRHGPKWCQRHVINNMLIPMIESENTKEKVKIFCIKMLGPLFKPYPADMKVHCEIIVNQLLDMLDQENLSHSVKEAIFTSLIYMSKHNPPRVTKALLTWHPESISAELENLLKAYVQEKPIKAWKTILSKTYV